MNKITEYQYKWRENNIEKYRGYVRKSVAKHYENNREKKINDELKRYYYKKECKIFLNILL